MKSFHQVTSHLNQDSTCHHGFVDRCFLSGNANDLANVTGLEGWPGDRVTVRHSCRISTEYEGKG